jgi:hypothetical protein
MVESGKGAMKNDEEDEKHSRAKLTSLRKQISALREYMSSYQSSDPTPEKRKTFRMLVNMSGPVVQSARFCSA